VTNDETIMREVDQALAEEKASEGIRKNLPLIVAAGLAVVAGVGGWQFWSAQREAKAVAASAAYEKALKAGSDEERIAALEKLGGDSGGYAILAKLRLAGEAAGKGERDKALGFYREVYAAAAGSKRLKDAARLKAGYLALDVGRDAVLKDVGVLETDDTAIGYYAREIIALAALEAGDFQAAEQMFRKAASDPKAPQSIQLRAGEYAALASAGKAGVKFPAVEQSKKSEDELYLEQLEKAGSDLSTVLDAAPAASDAAAHGEADGHAHEAETPVQPEGNE
jgi:hypothetical protein